MRSSVISGVTDSRRALRMTELCECSDSRANTHGIRNHYLKLRIIVDLADDLQPYCCVRCFRRRQNCNATKPVSASGFRGVGICVSSCCACQKPGRRMMA
ncbi:hypothetical protein BC629DRAFT_1555050 [Irpex lacteus]|nr:hypothetical protein BC629DRAFT_1555050 [Irpex lacteus]